ncbi:MAG TPA: purine-nucleoside phosphorylase [Candidatus Cloacimonas sp.]|nr:purine-nucleoside phosphorylase [Candidatus Cloacimonas sp.]
MNSYLETAVWLKSKLPRKPQIAIILGTGLNNMAKSFPLLYSLPYNQIPGFVQSTAPTHKGNLLLGEVGGIPVLFLQGRFHYYEGYTMAEVVFPVRVLASLGIKVLIVTNASGSLRKELEPGTIVRLQDHINFMGTNPLIGINDDEIGERFPSLNQPYDSELCLMADKVASELEIKTTKGVYIAVTGPSMETKAECSTFALWGADIVGMSTVPEVITARHSGLKVLAYSIVTNYSNLFHNLEHSQEEIQAVASVAGEKLQKIIAELIPRLARTFSLTP